MQQDAHAARMLSLVAVPLTLRTALARATVSNPGFVDYPQAAVSFLPTFLEKELLAFWATDSPICLEYKVLTCVVPVFPGTSDDRWP
jgi:hypothetical protein